MDNFAFNPTQLDHKTTEIGKDIHPKHNKVSEFERKVKASGLMFWGESLCFGDRPLCFGEWPYVLKAH